MEELSPGQILRCQAKLKQRHNGETELLLTDAKGSQHAISFPTPFVVDNFVANQNGELVAVFEIITVSDNTNWVRFAGKDFNCMLITDKLRLLVSGSTPVPKPTA